MSRSFDRASCCVADHLFIAAGRKSTTGKATKADKPTVGSRQSLLFGASTPVEKEKEKKDRKKKSNGEEESQDTVVKSGGLRKFMNGAGGSKASVAAAEDGEEEEIVETQEDVEMEETQVEVSPSVPFGIELC